MLCSGSMGCGPMDRVKVCHSMGHIVKVAVDLFLGFCSANVERVACIHSWVRCWLRLAICFAAVAHGDPTACWND